MNGPAEEDEEGGGVELDFDTAFPDELSTSDVDEESADLDIGAVIELDAQEPEPDGEGLALDFVGLLATAEDATAQDDESGPSTLDLGAGLDSAPGQAGDDDEAMEGLDTDAIEPLPQLDADDEPWSDDAEPPLPTVMRDAPPPPWSESPWRWDALPAPLPPCATMAMGADRIVVGGNGLGWITAASGELARTVTNRSVTAVALVGPAPVVALVATFGTDLVRVTPAGEVEPSARGHQVTGLPAATSSAVELHTLTGGVTGSVLCRTMEGVLLRSEDGGRRWTALDLGGRVAAVGTGVDAPLALVLTATGPFLAQGTHDGSAWVRHPLTGPVTSLLDADSLRLGGIDGCVLLVSPGRGAALSTDRGHTFRALEGLAGATALAVGRVGGRPAAWIALFSDLADATELVFIDLDREEPLRVARIDSVTDDDGARVAALAWDDAAGRLWAVGTFGAGSFAPPRQ